MTPIPPPLWARLAALDRRCASISMHRNDWDQGGRFVRGWRVTLVPRDGLPHQAIRAEAPTLAEALERAVTEAEGRWWAR